MSSDSFVNPYPRTWTHKSSSSSASYTPHGVYYTAPYTPYQNFEDETSENVEQDDTVLLEKRYREHKQQQQSPSPSLKSMKSQTQWTRSLDVVQEHFSSHVILDGVSHKIPPLIYALKRTAKRDWVLYKKRECERRKRVREKVEAEKKKERRGEPSNVLLTMVDTCEGCKRLYVTVNLFWGVTLCDSCYFNRDFLIEIMDKRLDMAEDKIEISTDNIAEEVIRIQQEFATPYPSPSPSPSPAPEKATEDYFYNVLPFEAPSKEDGVLFISRKVPKPHLPQKKRNLKRPRKNSMPTTHINSESSSSSSSSPFSPGEKPGNLFEKFEVREGVIRAAHNDNPYFEEKSSSSPPPPSPPHHAPPPPPPNSLIREMFTEIEKQNTFEQQQNHYSPNAILGWTPNSFPASPLPFSPNLPFTSTTFEDSDSLLLGDYASLREDSQFMNSQLDYLHSQPSFSQFLQ